MSSKPESSKRGGVAHRVRGRDLAYEEIESHQLVKVTAQQRDGEPTLVIVEYRGEEWTFEKHGRALEQQGDRDVPGPVRGACLQVGIGRVEA